MDSKFAFFVTSNLSKSAIVLVLFGMLDALFTDIGIRHALIEEANPLMRFIYELSIPTFYSIKIGLPFVLLCCSLKIKPKPYIQLVVSSALLLYLAVIILHVFWMLVALSA